MGRETFVIRTEDDFIRAHMTALYRRAARRNRKVCDISRAPMRFPGSKQSEKALPPSLAQN